MLSNRISLSSVGLTIGIVVVLIVLYLLVTPKNLFALPTNTQINYEIVNALPISPIKITDDGGGDFECDNTGCTGQLLSIAGQIRFGFYVQDIGVPLEGFYLVQEHLTIPSSVGLTIEGGYFAGVQGPLPGTIGTYTYCAGEEDVFTSVGIICDYIFSLRAGNQSYAWTDKFNWTGGPHDVAFNIIDSGFILEEGIREQLALLDAKMLSAEPQCPFCTVDAQGNVEGINTLNGNYSQLSNDVSIPTAGGSLDFERNYSSGGRDAYDNVPTLLTESVVTSALGGGWVHNYEMRLIEGELFGRETLDLQTHGGSFISFFKESNGSYTPATGVTASLVDTGSQYEVTTFNQSIYIFDSEGRMVEQHSPLGHIIEFEYDGAGRLEIAKQGGRSLNYSYHPTTGRLKTVTDHTGRFIILGYDLGTGDLTTVTNPLGQTTTYVYEGNDGLLTKEINSMGEIVNDISYDASGRAYEKRDNEDNVIANISYPIAPSGTVSESIVFHNGITTTHHYYTVRRTLVGIQQDCNTTDCPTLELGYDENFKTNHIIDENKHRTQLDWDDTGSNLEEITDALGNTTSMLYDGLNNLLEVTNARGHMTTHTYGNGSFPAFRTSMVDELGNTTQYIPDPITGFLASQTDPNGVVTAYTYNTYGQMETMVRGAGTSSELTIQYDYDDLGRLETTTEVSASESLTSLNVYDDGDQLLATINNWTGSDPTDWQNSCDRDPSPRSRNICTTYAYDDAGRVISMTNPIGQTDLYDYDENGRITLVVENVSDDHDDYPIDLLCQVSTTEYNLCNHTFYDIHGRVDYTLDPLLRSNKTFYDNLGRVSQTVTNYDDGVYDPLDPDTDIITQYEYDAVGNTIVMTDTLNRATRNFYNELNQLVVTIENWDGEINTIADAQTACSVGSLYRDFNVCTFYTYDEVGNLIITQDALGRQTRTFYDALNRTIAMVQNWDGMLTDPQNCVISNPNLATENICTLYEYDGLNLTETTNALGQVSLTVYDDLSRPYIQVANWTGVSITNESDCAFPPVNADENLCTVTYYDDLGRRSVTKNPVEQLTEYDYNISLGTTSIIRYLNNQAVNTTVSANALGSPIFQMDANGFTVISYYDSLNRLIRVDSQEGVSNSTTYDLMGRALTTTDGLGNTTTNQYDDLDRLISTTDPSGNTTTYEYDGLGNRIAIIDAEGIRTGYVYDGLNRLVAVIENETNSNPTYTNETNVTTQYRYDIVGNRTAITNALTLTTGETVTSTLTIYDDLNRPIIVADALGNQTQYTYDAIGNRVTMVDGNGDTTIYTYDDVNRLETTSFSIEPTETITHTYDALGNVLTMTDGQGVTQYTYDDLNRITDVVDTFGDTVSYDYDNVGNRTQLTYPDSRTVDYTYDGDHRLTTVTDWDGGITTYSYDLAGRLITTTLPNGIITSQTYDLASRLTELSHHTAYNDLLARFTYQLDNVGNRITATETLYAPPINLSLTLSSQLTVTTGTDEQRLATSAYNENADEYLVAWQDESGADTDLAVRVLDSSGSAQSPITNLPPITDTQDLLDVAYSSTGDVYLLVWSDQRDGNRDIYGQLLSANGQPTGSEIAIDTDPNTVARDPRVTYDPDSGGFVVVWAAGSGNDLDIQAQFIDHTGVLGTNFAVTTGTAKDDTPAIATDGQGTFLVVWQQNEDTLADIMGQLFTDAGLHQSAFPVTDALDLQDKPAVSFHAYSQQYLVVWEHKDIGTSPRRIHARFVTAAGTTPNPSFVFDDFGTNPTLYPDVLGLDDGFLVTAHRSGNVFAGTVTVAGEPDNLTVLSQSANSQYRVNLAGAGDTALATWESDELGTDYDLFGKLATLAPESSQPETTVISYTYDPLYRLTHAVYTGAQEAEFEYFYDAVGNMTSYEETIDGTFATVMRVFNEANQLVISQDLGGEGTYSYSYDANGNLVQIRPPGVTWEGTVQYTFNQRNLLTAYDVHDGIDWVTLTEYAYDGNGDRVQQVVYDNGTPITTNYTNDPQGLTQMLVSETDGDATYNIFGQGLIASETAGGTYFSLADGLGSVRIELVDGVVTNISTYSPYGKLIAQIGWFGTAYGYAGEQYDQMTQLVYLRARYYSPASRIFVSADSFSGYVFLPQTQHTYTYVYNNPVNLTDPSGYDAWWCNSQDYSGIPSYAVNEAIQNCYAQYTQATWRQWYQFPPLFGSEAPYLVYESDDGYVGRLYLYNSPVGTVSWAARSGAFAGDNNSGIPELSNDNSNRGVPYITNSGFFSDPEGQRYSAGEVCYSGQCYSYPAGTFPIDWPDLSRWQYDNFFRPSKWVESVWGRYRITLDEQNPLLFSLLGIPAPNNISSGVFIHAGNPDNPTYGCVRLTQEGAMGELVNYLNQLNEPLRLFINTPPLPSQPDGEDTWWYNPFANEPNASNYSIQDGIWTIPESPENN